MADNDRAVEKYSVYSVREDLANGRATIVPKVIIIKHLFHFCILNLEYATSVGFLHQSCEQPL